MEKKQKFIYIVVGMIILFALSYNVYQQMFKISDNFDDKDSINEVYLMSSHCNTPIFY